MVKFTSHLLKDPKLRETEGINTMLVEFVIIKRFMKYLVCSVTILNMKLTVCIIPFDFSSFHPT